MSAQGHVENADETGDIQIKEGLVEMAHDRLIRADGVSGGSPGGHGAREGLPSASKIAAEVGCIATRRLPSGRRFQMAFTFQKTIRNHQAFSHYASPIFG